MGLKAIKRRKGTIVTKDTRKVTKDIITVTNTKVITDPAAERRKEER